MAKKMDPGVGLGGGYKAPKSAGKKMTQQENHPHSRGGKKMPKVSGGHPNRVATDGNG